MLSSCCTATPESARAKHLSESFCNGKYLDVIKEFDGTPMSNGALLEFLSRIGNSGNSVYKQVHDLVLSFISDGDNGSKVERTFECLLLGISYLELYCQTNYTGPELPPALLAVFNVNGAACVQELECDGTYAFRSIELPQTLLLARIILSTLAEPHTSGWKEGISLDVKGGVSRKQLPDSEVAASLVEERQVLKSVMWWSARAAVVHLRLLQKQTYDDVPTLWNEVTEKFATVLHTFSSLPQEVSLLMATAPANEDSREENKQPESANGSGDNTEQQAPPPALGQLPDTVLRLADFSEQFSADNSAALAGSWESLRKQLGAQAWLEWGLCCLHFSFGDKVIMIYYVQAFFVAVYLTPSLHREL